MSTTNTILPRRLRYGITNWGLEQPSDAWQARIRRVSRTLPCRRFLPQANAVRHTQQDPCRPRVNVMMFRASAFTPSASSRWCHQFEGGRRTVIRGLEGRRRRLAFFHTWQPHPSCKPPNVEYFRRLRSVGNSAMDRLDQDVGCRTQKLTKVIWNEQVVGRLELGCCWPVESLCLFKGVKSTEPRPHRHVAWRILPSSYSHSVTSSCMHGRLAV